MLGSNPALTGSTSVAAEATGLGMAGGSLLKGFWNGRREISTVACPAGLSGLAELGLTLSVMMSLASSRLNSSWISGGVSESDNGTITFLPVGWGLYAGIPESSVGAEDASIDES